MWNYHGNASCSWQEILLSQARDKGAIKNTFLHSFSCSPPTGRHYLAFETQDSAFGNQLVFGRWWEPVVWWETRCLQYLLCCSWSKFLFSYVFNSAEKCQKISFHVYYFHAQTNRFAGLEGGRVERCHRTCRTSSAGVAKQHWVPKQMCRLGGCWVMVSSWCLFGTSATWGSLFSSVEGGLMGTQGVCAPCAPNGSVSRLLLMQRFISCMLLAWLKRELQVLES